MNSVILGAGAWGTAMALHLQRVGHSVILVPRRNDHALSLLKARENKDYLPGFLLPGAIKINSDIKEALVNADIIFFACPSHGLRELAKSVKEKISSKHSIKGFITLAKGLEQSSLLGPVEVLEKELTDLPCGILSGPTHAAEIAAGKPAAVILGMNSFCTDIESLQKRMSNEVFRIYRSRDLRGVELGCCLKNVYAIGAGMCDGLELGDNAKAAYLTRALYEMVKLGTRLGGRVETFYGLSGFGDLVATCTGEWSRNRTFGEELSKEGNAVALIHKRKTVVEGYWATRCFKELVTKNSIEAPILMELYAILYEGKSLKEAIYSLMTRQLKAEVEG